MRPLGNGHKAIWDGEMSSTYTNLNYHIVFSTKHRNPIILPEWQGSLHRYLAGTLKGIGGSPLEVNGAPDHVHILGGLPPNQCVSDAVREIKKASSKWIRKTRSRMDFAWQAGYAAFSVSHSVVPSVREYIQTQEAHHRKTSFREELVELLEKEGIEFDLRYLD